ncbi:MAG: OadG family transporter subunit [Gemmiger sp.]|nr:OadG family transporter subunit [Gemmiger sp.]
MNTLAMLSIDGFDMTVVATSITLVFCMLAGLCLIIMLEGKLFDNINAKKQAKAHQAIEAQAKAAAPAPVAAPAPAPAVEQGITGDIVAAIAAAVSFVTGGNATVRSIRKSGAKGSRRGAWGDAGVGENTRPFM